MYEREVNSKLTVKVMPPCTRMSLKRWVTQQSQLAIVSW